MSDFQEQAIFAPLEGTQTAFRQVEERLTTLEAAVATIETERAVSEEKRKFMEVRFNQIDQRLEKINGHIARLIWVIIAAIVGGFVSFVAQGSGMGI